MSTAAAAAHHAMDDQGLARLAQGGDAAAARVLLTRHNQRLFRAAFGVLKDRAEAEEAVQDAWLNAFAGLDGFRGESAFSTWLTRIVLNEALGRRRAAERRRRQLEAGGVSLLDDYREALMPARSQEDADAALMRSQASALLEGAISRLPDPFRTVFMLREVNELSVEETAEALGIPEDTVKTRLFRARRRLREDLGSELKSGLVDAFVFCGADCAALTDKVLTRLGLA